MSGVSGQVLSGGVMCQVVLGGGVRWCPVSCGVRCQVSGVNCKLSAVRLAKTW